MLAKKGKQLPYLDVTPFERAELLGKAAGFSVEPGLIACVFTPQSFDSTVNGKDTTRSRTRKLHAQGTAERTATNSMVFWHVGNTRHD